MANLTACHRDPKYWKNPDKFFPEHFLDSEGKFTEEKEGFVPFGYGKTFYQIGKKSDMVFFKGAPTKIIRFQTFLRCYVSSELNFIWMILMAIAIDLHKHKNCAN